jgi:hypothetical protein
VLTVAAVLPLQAYLFSLVTGEIQFTKNMIAVITLDWILSRREKPFFVFRTEYFHFGCSLRRYSRPQAV